MGRMSKYTFFQRRHTDDQKAHEKCPTLVTKNELLIIIFIIITNDNSNKFIVLIIF